MITTMRTIQARMRGGMLEPLEQVGIPEGQALTITIAIPTIKPVQKIKPHLAVWHLGHLKGTLTRDEIYGDLI